MPIVNNITRKYNMTHKDAGVNNDSHTKGQGYNFCNLEANPFSDKVEHRTIDESENKISTAAKAEGWNNARISCYIQRPGRIVPQADTKNLTPEVADGKLAQKHKGADEKEWYDIG